PDVARGKPVIVPDLRTNCLLVSAGPDDTRIIQQLLKKVDVELKDPAVQLVVIPLKHNDAGVVAPTIRNIFAARLKSMTPQGETPTPQDQVDVDTDVLSNSLILSASKENLALIRSLLDKVDVEPPAETGIVRMYLLMNSDAQRVGSMLQGLLREGLYKPGALAAGQSPALAAREKVSIATDIRTNVLIVSASKENFAVIEEILKRIDASEDFTLLGDVQIYTLKHADATRLAPTLQQFFQAKRAAEQATGGTGRSLPVSIIPDARTNTLLVAGSRESFRAIEVMIAKLDAKEVLAETEFRIFELKHATAAKLQATLQRLFDQRVVRDTKKNPVTLIADTQANSLIVGATAEDMKLAESLVSRLDVAGAEAGKTLQIFPLKKADAAQVAATLRDLYKAQAGGADPGVSITIDERINALVVSAGEAELKRIEELIAQLDRETLTGVMEIRFFALRYADAAELAQILTDTLTKKPTPLTKVSPNRQSLLQFITRTKEGKDLVAVALQEGVLVTPDRRTNSLVILAPADNMPFLESLVSALDAADPRRAEIRVFTLKNADSRQMADVLTELFALKAAAGQSTRAVEYTLVATQPAVGAEKGPSARIGSDEQRALTVTVDVRTNSLLVGGTKEYVEMCERVIQELDASPAQGRIIRIVRLKNARAADVQGAVRSVLDQELQRVRNALGADRMGAVERLLEREIAVVAVPADGSTENANTLLLSASPRYFETIAKMIQELDAPPPQVLIQVLLAEVTLDDAVGIGAEWTYASELPANRKQVVGTSLGVVGDFQREGGFNVSITSGDFSFFLRALQDQGRLEVLDRPQILASDNKNARFNVGQSVPYVDNSRVTEGGTTINTISYRDVGVILNVTPRINPEGFVKLEIDSEISSISASRIEITEGLNATVFNVRQATTTVTVQDRHTIVIGGLLRTKDEQREKKVPILGDIPFLGNLFKSSSTVKERTELLIVLTPQVVQDVPVADSITAAELERLKLLRAVEKDGPTKGAIFTPLETLLSGKEGPTSRPAGRPDETPPDGRKEAPK
ncbi:MAG TPA: secretin N-terminal domain-containing protein, partial [Phycisphaerae bacterium]|nr:secretin N-terminal domain-containing protein [Phycisphaerae bacterium]